jgi:hypothetical protein
MSFVSSVWFTHSKGKVIRKMISQNQEWKTHICIMRESVSGAQCALFPYFKAALLPVYHRALARDGRIFVRFTFWLSCEAWKMYLLNHTRARIQMRPGRHGDTFRWESRVAIWRATRRNAKGASRSRTLLAINHGALPDWEPAPLSTNSLAAHSLTAHTARQRERGWLRVLTLIYQAPHLHFKQRGGTSQNQF